MKYIYDNKKYDTDKPEEIEKDFSVQFRVRPQDEVKLRLWLNSQPITSYDWSWFIN